MKKLVSSLLAVSIGVFIVSCERDVLKDKANQGGMFSAQETDSDGSLDDWESGFLEGGCAYHLITAPRPIAEYLDEVEPEKDFIDELLDDVAYHFANEYCASSDIKVDLWNFVDGRMFYAGMMDDFLDAYPQYTSSFDQMLLTQIGMNFSTLNAQGISWEGFDYELEIFVENFNTCNWDADPIFVAGTEVDYGVLDYIPGYMVNRESEPCEFEEVLLGKYEPAGSAEEDTITYPLDTNCLENPIIVFGIQSIDGAGKWNGDGADDAPPATNDGQYEPASRFILTEFFTGGKAYDRGRYFSPRWEWRSTNTLDGSAQPGYSTGIRRGLQRCSNVPAAISFNGGTRDHIKGQVTSVSNVSTPKMLRSYSGLFNHYGVAYEYDWFAAPEPHKWGPDVLPNVGRDLVVWCKHAGLHEYYTYIVIRTPDDYCNGSQLPFTEKFGANGYVAQ